MLRALASLTCLALSTLALSGAPAAQQNKPLNDGDRVILITLDGARHQEMFGGLDVDVLRSTLREGQKVEDQPVYRRFWADTPEARRRKLMPFFWNTWMASHGSIAGNRALGSTVSLTNKHWFSYPGYSEILVGQAFDSEIKSNDPVQNPKRTVLEALRERLALPRERVATFGSWLVFNQIVEHTPGATLVDAGWDTKKPADPRLADLALFQREALSPWDGIRFDVFTFKLAMAHLAASRPRVMYLALGETDDWAHDGRYDRVLDAFARSDRFFEELWTWVQAQPDYRDRTHILLTTDHGRGRTTADWRHHGAKVSGADEVWIAFVSPRMKQRGEWRGHQPLFTNQVAATFAGWLGIDWRALQLTAGAPIQ